MSLESDLQDSAAAVISGSPTANALDLSGTFGGGPSARNLEEPFASTGQQGTWGAGSPVVDRPFERACEAILDPKWTPTGGGASPLVAVREYTKNGQGYYLIVARVVAP